MTYSKLLPTPSIHSSRVRCFHVNFFQTVTFSILLDNEEHMANMFVAA